MRLRDMRSFLPGTSITVVSAFCRLCVAGLITVTIGGAGLLLGAPELILPQATATAARMTAFLHL